MVRYGLGKRPAIPSFSKTIAIFAAQFIQMENDMLTATGLYTDQEVQSGVKELFENEAFVQGMLKFLPTDLGQHFLKVSQDIQNTFEFQRDIVHPLLELLIKQSMQQLSSSGLENLDPKQKYLFISNHRDIGLDSAFLNLLLFDHGFTTTQIAIGDNLIKHRIAELIFRINKSFIVRRSGAPRELYQSSLELSAYINEMVASGKDSVWLAQREGRAKDGNDQTQLGLLKMLSMSATDKNLARHFQQLNIVPVAIAYEFNPCDYFMAKEYVERLENPAYKKTFADDMASILQGLKGDKGHVHISFGKPLAIEQLLQEKSTKESLQIIAAQINQQIHQSYHLSPINYYAFDELLDTPKYLDKYSPEQKDQLAQYFAERIHKFSEEQKETALDYLLKMYAYPVRNAESY